MELVADESKDLNSCWTASSTDLQGFDALNFHLVITIPNPEHVGDLTLTRFMDLALSSPVPGSR